MEGSYYDMPDYVNVVDDKGNAIKQEYKSYQKEREEKDDAESDR